jgi:hypothetical protein
LQRENRYLAREMCWVPTVQGLETYMLAPRDPADLDLLIGAIEPHESPWISTVIGVRDPVAPPDYCNGLMVPIVMFDHVYTLAADQFGAASHELFVRIMQMIDNGGATDTVSPL